MGLQQTPGSSQYIFMMFHLCFCFSILISFRCNYQAEPRFHICLFFHPRKIQSFHSLMRFSTAEELILASNSTSTWRRQWWKSANLCVHISPVRFWFSAKQVRGTDDVGWALFTEQRDLLHICGGVRPAVRNGRRDFPLLLQGPITKEKNNSPPFQLRHTYTLLIKQRPPVATLLITSLLENTFYMNLIRDENKVTDLTETNK